MNLQTVVKASLPACHNHTVWDLCAYRIMGRVSSIAVYTKAVAAIILAKFNTKIKLLLVISYRLLFFIRMQAI